MPWYDLGHQYSTLHVFLCNIIHIHNNTLCTVLHLHDCAVYIITVHVLIPVLKLKKKKKKTKFNLKIILHYHFILHEIRKARYFTYCIHLHESLKVTCTYNLVLSSLLKLLQTTSFEINLIHLGCHNPLSKSQCHEHAWTFWLHMTSSSQGKTQLAFCSLQLI